MNYLNLAGIVIGSASVGAILGFFGMAALVNYDDEQEADRLYRLGLAHGGRRDSDRVTEGAWREKRTAQSDLEEDR